MAEFEDACEKKGLRLFVLPPKSPQMNGAVERCNRRLAIRILRRLRPAEIRRRRSIRSSTASSTSTTITDQTEPLGRRTPSHYLAQRTANETHPSHMS